MDPRTSLAPHALHPDELDVPVAGGTLRVCRWPGAGPVVLAAHGITANALSYAEVGAALAGRATLIAPDLRGRAGSRDLPGPYGMAAHADDLVAILDHLGITHPVPVVGHSMGGFVAAVAGVRHPDRFSSVLLVDGGVALQVPSGADIDAVLEAVIGPAMRRLTMTFANREAYLDFFRAHPALGAAWSPAIEAYLLRDLVGEAPELRSSCVLEAIRADGTDTLVTPETIDSAHRLTQPVRLLFAARGMLDEPHGLYDERRLAGIGLPARVAVQRVDGVNHYTILAGPRGAALLAHRILEMIDER
jgi:pimeloyl-ACP methyl ester carboxylesterase